MILHSKIDEVLEKNVGEDEELLKKIKSLLF